MNVPIHPYDLPDAALLIASAEALRCLVWRPPRTVIVIGKGSDPWKEVRVTRVVRDGIPILRRDTGGATVVLSPEMLVVSVAVQQREQLPSRQYFRMLNSLVIRALARQGVDGVEPQGVSDLAIDERKIAGSAIYRNRHLVFYHTVLNVSGGTDVMETYLLTPPRMPDYRRGRTHADFVTSLSELGYALDVAQFSADVQADFYALGPRVVAPAFAKVEE